MALQAVPDSTLHVHYIPHDGGIANGALEVFEVNGVTGGDNRRPARHLGMAVRRRDEKPGHQTQDSDRSANHTFVPHVIYTPDKYCPPEWWS